MIDIGANLTGKAFDGDRDAVVDRALAAGVTRIVVTGSSAVESRAAADLAASRPGVLFATAGVHPHLASGWDDSTAGDLTALLGRPHVVAVGECGLDFDRDYSPRDDQRRAFAAQLELAHATGLPVFLHERAAHEDFLELLRQASPLPSGGVVHCFTGGRAELDAYLELGMHIGITGWICDERRGEDLFRTAPHVPLDRLLIETDAPYLLPRTLRPKPRSRRNEPMYLCAVRDRVAQAMGVAPAVIDEASTRNAERLFGLPPPARGGAR